MSREMLTRLTVSRKLLFGFTKGRVVGSFRIKLLRHNRSICKCLFTTQTRRTLATSTYYDTLGVAKDAKPSEIKEAYIEKTKEHHPDAKSSSNADDFLKISEAYKVLSNSSLRRQYDFQQFGKSSDFNRFETGEYNLPKKENVRQSQQRDGRTIRTDRRKTEPIIDESIKIALSGNARMVLDYLLGGLVTICVAMYLISRYQKRKHNNQEDDND